MRRVRFILIKKTYFFFIYISFKARKKEIIKTFLALRIHFFKCGSSLLVIRKMIKREKIKNTGRVKSEKVVLTYKLDQYKNLEG